MQSADRLRVFYLTDRFAELTGRRSNTIQFAMCAACAGLPEALELAERRVAEAHELKSRGENKNHVE
jgi:hypothetical protein